MSDQEWLDKQTKKLKQMEENLSKSAYQQLKETSLHITQMIDGELKKIKGQLQYADDEAKEELSMALDKILIYTTKQQNLSKPPFLFGNKLKIEQDQFKSDLVQILEAINDLMIKDTTESMLFQQNIIEPKNQIVIKTQVIVRWINENNEQQDDSYISSLIFEQMQTNKYFFKHQLTLKKIINKIRKLQVNSLNQQDVIFDVIIQDQPRHLTMKIHNPKISFGLIGNNLLDHKQFNLKNYYELMEDSVISISKNYNLIIEDVKVKANNEQNEQFKQRPKLRNCFEKYLSLKTQPKNKDLQKYEQNYQFYNQDQIMVIKDQMKEDQQLGAVELLDDDLSHEIVLDFNAETNKYEIQCTRILEETTFLPQIKKVLSIQAKQDEQNKVYSVILEDKVQITITFLEDWGKKDIEYGFG